MKIVFTGGGSGGHFYPIVAVAEEVNKLVKENKLIDVDLYYLSNNPYNEGVLYDHNITFKKISAGKLRLYFSLMNFIDLFKTFFGTIDALWEIFKIYPDVIFGKGGYASFPALLAGKILRIPVVIHESDSVPGRVNVWAGKFAKRIALSYKESAKYFPTEKTAYTGNPIRVEIMEPLESGADEFLKLDKNIPTIFVLGGSLGSEIINEIILNSITDLLPKYQIIHQTGKNNLAFVKETSEVLLKDNPYKNRYKVFDYLNVLAMRMSAGISSIIISRAGSTIFEIASWGKPSIIIPITNSNGNHQRENAYAYARAGACSVIEEKNLTKHLFIAEIDRIVSKPEEIEKMKEATKSFVHKDAARKIATELLNIVLEHEK